MVGETALGHEIRCSFCRKSTDEIRRLVAGPDAFICDECTAKFLEALRKDRLLACDWCGKKHEDVRSILGGPTAFICDECIELCADIVREETKAIARK